MATIRPRGDKWQAIVRKKGHPPQAKTFTRKKDAETWATVVESEMERGEFVDRSEADRMAFGEALQKYQDTVTERKKGARQEKARIAYWKRHKLAKMAMSKLRPNHFSEWRDEELKTKSPNTVRNHLTLVSHLFNHARKEWGLPVKNPIAELWRPKRPPNRKRRYRDGEEERLLDAAAKLHALLPYAIIVLTETAMRRGDLCSMERKHLDLSKRIHFIPDTKNGEPRYVPLSQRAIEALSALPVRLDGRVWPWLNPDSLTHLFTEAVQLAGMEDFHLHDLRHEATSRLAKIYEVHQLAKVRGDVTLNELMSYYHPTADELVERLDHSTPSAPSLRAKP